MSEYAIYDVFTDRAFGGNPLAVVFDGGKYNDEQMQRIARELIFRKPAFFVQRTRLAIPHGCAIHAGTGTAIRRPSHSWYGCGAC